MPDSHISSFASPEQLVRPAIVADERTLRDRDAYLRHCFVGFADESCRGILLCPAEAEPGQVAAAPVEVIQFPPLMAMGLWQPILSPLIEKLQKAKPTILHCVSQSKLKLTSRLSQILDIPFVVSMDSATKHRWKRFCAGKFSGIVTPSESMTAWVRGEMGGSTDVVRCIKVGTFVSERTACFAGTGKLVTMVIVHPLERISDFEPVFSAIKHLSIDGVEMVVALMGSGRADRKVRHLIGDLGLGNVINIVPEIRPLRKVFSGADILIKPARSNGFDFSLLDAMSEGMAVAACKGNEEDLLSKGQTAAVFEEGDTVSIYTTLAGLVRERNHTRHLAKGAQDLLRAEYKVSVMVAELIDFYGKAASRWAQ